MDELLEHSNLNNFWSANFVINNGNIWLFAIDSIGYGYYFYTYNLKQIKYHSKFWLGGIPFTSL